MVQKTENFERNKYQILIVRKYKVFYSDMILFP
jgi:hypothetical protein